MRPIDADEMKKQLCEGCGILYGTDVEKCDKNCAWMNAVDCMKTIDVQPMVHGKWIDKGNAAGLFCSECNFKVRYRDERRFNYCPNCSVRIDKE